MTEIMENKQSSNFEAQKQNLFTNWEGECNYSLFQPAVT